MSLKKDHLLIPGFLVFIALTLLAYQGGISHTLILDDVPNLEGLKNLDRGYNPNDFIFNNHSGPLGRPLSMATFYLNYISSNLVSDFKAFNLALHIIIGLLIFLLFNRLLQNFYNKELAGVMSFGVSVLWLASPMNTSTVLYVVQRMTILATLFSFIGMFSYVLGRERLIQNKLNGWIFIATSFLIFWPLAYLSKENGLLLPLFLLLIEVQFYKFKGVFTSDYQKKLFYIFLFFSLVVMTILSISSIQRHMVGYDLREFDLYERLLTQPRVIFDYIRNLILPKTGYLGLIHDDFLISKSLLNPITTIFSIILLASMILLSIIGSFRNNSIKIISFGFQFYLIGHLIESTIFPLEIYFEHRNYLSGSGIYLSLIGVITIIWQHSKIVNAMALLPILFLFSTYQKAESWETEASLVASMYYAHPESIRANIMMTKIFHEQGEHKKELAILNNLKSKNDLFIGASLHLLHHKCVMEEELDETDFDLIIDNITSNNRGLRNIQYEISTMGALSNALTSECPNWEDARLSELTYSWAKYSARNLKGKTLEALLIYSAKILATQKQWDKAIELVALALNEAPSNTDHHLFLVSYLIEDQQFQRAEKELDMLLTRNESINEFHREITESFQLFLLNQRRETDD